MNTGIDLVYDDARTPSTANASARGRQLRHGSGVKRLVGRILSLLERGFVVFSLLVGVGGIAAFVPYENPFDVSEGSLVLRRIWMANYLITLILVAPRWKRVITPLLRDPVLILLMALVALSLSWSETPEIALRRAVALFGTTLFGAYMAARFSFRDQLVLVITMCTIAMLMSIAIVFLIPEMGIMTQGAYQGAWRGSFSHKNPLARTMVLAALAYALIPTQTLLGRASRWLGIFAAVGLVMMANSATAILALVALWGFYRLVRMQRWQARARLAVFAIGAAGAISVGVLIIDNLEVIFGWFGRDTSLTGRTLLWSSAIQMIEQRPLLGYGYSSFWLGAQSAAGIIWQAVGWDPGHAHNGFVDLTLDLGLLGLCLYLIHYSISFFRALGFSRAIENGIGVWPIMYLGNVLIYNQTESAIIKQNHSFWILYVAVVLSLRIYGGGVMTPVQKAPASPGAT